MKTNVLNNGDGICFFNEEKELIGTKINKIEGNLIFPTEIKGIKPGIKIYRNYNKVFDTKINNTNITRKLSAKLRGREISTGYIFFLEDEDGNCAQQMISNKVELAENKEKALNTIIVQLSKSGNTEFRIKETDIKLKNIPHFKVSKINEIRRNLTNKLRKIRKKNYKYKYRKTPIKIVEYPISKLNYKANILNDKAALFYKRRGCCIEEMALESQKNITEKEVMISKYCIKNQLGLCSKQTAVKKFIEPYTLIDEFNKEYLVEFNCKDCVMKIRTKN